MILTGPREDPGYSLMSVNPSLDAFRTKSRRDLIVNGSLIMEIVKNIQIRKCTIPEYSERMYSGMATTVKSDRKNIDEEVVQTLGL